MVEPFLSIIISVYNISGWIKKNIDLILYQSFSNYEILIINDGSSDISADFCNDLEQRNPKLRVIHQTNQGLGGARNTGVKHAKGDYICFFDLDDFVKEDWLEKIRNIIYHIQPDILVYSYREINQKYNTITELVFQDKILKSNKEIRDNYVELLSGLRFNNGFAWNKVYKREFLINNNIKFPDLRIQQDEVFNHEAYKHANSLITSSEVLYDYYIYDKGNTRSSYIPNRMEIFKKVKNSFISLANYWNLQNPDLNFYIHSRFIANSLFNRNPSNIEKFSTLRNKLFHNESLIESVFYILMNSVRLSYLEKLYFNAIIKKSRTLYALAEIYSQIRCKGGKFYHKILRVLYKI